MGRTGHVPLHDELARRVRGYWFRRTVYGVDNLFCMYVHNRKQFYMPDGYSPMTFTTPLSLRNLVDWNNYRNSREDDGTYFVWRTYCDYLDKVILRQ